MSSIKASQLRPAKKQLNNILTQMGIDVEFVWSEVIDKGYGIKVGVSTKDINIPKDVDGVPVRTIFLNDK